VGRVCLLSWQVHPSVFAPASVGPLGDGWRACPNPCGRRDRV